MLRLAGPDDLLTVEEIVRAAYSHCIARIGRAPGPMLDDYAGQIGAGRVHVAEHNGAVKGFLVLIPQ